MGYGDEGDVSATASAPADVDPTSLSEDVHQVNQGGKLKIGYCFFVRYNFKGQIQRQRARKSRRNQQPN